ncbi:hypothetical protein BS47DRAFT_1395808 [Hydnum rufescens UP504]|uniref:Uncharacterized protein n=1 Tax=Hydnum rufescens UP504 TaxID=1448309 RepID=A0A9P6ASF0_9AGAM|nr:hypothetical protein BS47DRAFT_1395808 [Hydnum rufescens UP504]
MLVTIVLRITGFHHRQYILNLQITHIHGIQLMGMAEWLQRRITKTTKRLVDAQPKLEACGHSSSFLHQQFAEQRIYQSKPITRQLKNSGIKAIEKIVALRESASAMKVAIASLESELMKYVLTDSIAVSSARFDILTSIEAKTRVLTRLQKDIDIATNHINLHDKHISVLSFESESSSSQTLNVPIVASKRYVHIYATLPTIILIIEMITDQKTRSHIEDAMHRREPTITGLAKKYNSMLKQMVQLRYKYYFSHTLQTFQSLSAVFHNLPDPSPRMLAHKPISPAPDAQATHTI